MHRHPSRLTVLLALTVIIPGTMGQASPPTYARSQYKHWIDADGDCQDTRVEVLVRDADPGTVQFEGDRNCTVDFARWKDPYTGNFVRHRSPPPAVIQSRRLGGLNLKGCTIVGTEPHPA